MRAEQLLGVLHRARRQREVRGRDDLAGLRHLLGRSPKPGGIGLANLGAREGEERRVHDQVRPIRAEQGGLLDELGERALVPGAGADAAQRLAVDGTAWRCRRAGGPPWG